MEVFGYSDFFRLHSSIIFDIWAALANFTCSSVLTTKGCHQGRVLEILEGFSLTSARERKGSMVI